MKNLIPRKGLHIIFLLLLTGISVITLSPSTCTAQTQSNKSSYSSLIQQADQAYAAKDYSTALLLYEKASFTKPELKYASGKIAEINALLDADPDSRPQLFETTIIKAENFYNQKEYASAKNEYQKALAIDPNSKFPKDRLKQISAVYTDPSDQEYYNDAVSNGDKALAASDFDKAILFYETALSVKPDSKVVKDKITNAKNQQSDLKIKEAQAAKIIAAADKLLQENKRSEARGEYQKALDLTPSNQYVAQKIQEIDKYNSDKKAIQDAYDKSIEQADQFYINRDFSNAQLKYQEALKAKPEARYPKEMLEKTKVGESQLQSDQQKYDASLASAENLFKSGDYEAAIIGYKSALAIKPAESYPKTKITEIEKLISERTSRKEAYDIAIKNGDQSFGEKKYDPALSHYRNALSLLPDEEYPKRKIEEITQLVSAQKTRDEGYRKSIAEADKLFTQKQYSESIASYSKALELKPDEQYPQQKITEAQNQLEKLKGIDENYASAIKAGDTYFSSQKYNEALAEYKQALTIKPSEKYPKEKSDEINKLLSKLKSESDKYTLAIANGDKALAAANYTVALTSFQEALTIKPAEQYPLDKITEINSAIAALKLIDEKYSAAIKSGDQLFTAKEYDRASAAYSEAAELKKNEKYPQDQLAKIAKILNEERTADQNYTQAITEGDKLFAEVKYSEAIVSYKKALTIKPLETYPKSQVEKINSLLAEQKKLDADYTAAIASADKLFASLKYEDAIDGYQKAIQLKPSEKYPADKITEARQLITDLKALGESYDKVVAEGDKYFTEKEYTSAMASFNTASGLKPKETYPKQKIAEIQAILDKDKAEGQRYQEALAQADKLYQEQKYKEALEPYQRATGIKPAEAYPKDQVVKINQLIAEQKKLDEDYQKLIADADIQFKTAKYSEARAQYSSASALKPAEKLPKDRIAEIDALLAEIQSKDQMYKDAVAEADANFNEKNYNEALNSYNRAIAIKPSETFPKSQVEKINSLLAEQKKLDDNYLSELATANRLFDENKFSEAIPSYRKALAIKPEEKYPAAKIAEAEKQITSLKALQETYDKAITDGDKKLAAKDYENALADFTTAKTAKPKETYPAQKIAEIQTILDKLKAENEKYTEAIALADKFFNGEKYREALEPYQRATTMKPREKYPQEQITRINQLLAEQKKLDDDYQKLLVEADVKLKEEKYTDALDLFTSAGKLKPSEQLPKDKINEIEAILASIKLKDENYTKAINTASELYAAKNLQGAIKSYEQASSIKPSEKHPLERIASIKTEIKAIDDKYSAAISQGDAKLASKDLMEALNSYQNALEIKPDETYPKTKIAEINTALAAQKEEQEKMYASYIADGDRLAEAKDYNAAKSAFTKATGIKPSEAYPKQRITEINKIVEEIELARRAEYNKALGEADKLYNSKIFDQAIDAYESASKMNLNDPYPQQQISKIRKYMSDHAIYDLFSQSLLIAEGNEKKFTFSSIEPRLRKNNYILLKARSAGKTAPKVYLNYGKDNQKNGGIVLRSLDKSEINDYLIRISVQDKWYREDNNWISLFVETGEIEITKVQIAAGDE